MRCGNPYRWTSCLGVCSGLGISALTYLHLDTDRSNIFFTQEGIFTMSRIYRSLGREEFTAGQYKCLLMKLTLTSSRVVPLSRLKSIGRYLT